MGNVGCGQRARQTDATVASGTVNDGWGLISGYMNRLKGVSLTAMKSITCAGTRDACAPIISKRLRIKTTFCGARVLPHGMLARPIANAATLSMRRTPIGILSNVSAGLVRMPGFGHIA